jgi:hypothetical protein
MTLSEKKKQWVEEFKMQLGVQTEKGRGSKKDITTIFNEYLKGTHTSEKTMNTVLYKKYEEEFDRLIKSLDYVNGEGKFEEFKA